MNLFHEKSVKISNQSFQRSRKQRGSRRTSRYVLENLNLNENGSEV
jgi:hypothetical protein